MEVTIKMIGLNEEDSFTTILDDKTELINIGEMIKEASYYLSFNLSEQFCLEVKDTNKFISGRSTIIKQCLNQNQIDPKILVFHKGLDGQLKMNKGTIIDQNFQREPQINNQVSQINTSGIHNQPQAQQHQSQPYEANLMKTNKNNQQGQGIAIGGIVIGGQITESQCIKNLEEKIKQGHQNNDIEVEDQVASQTNDLNQVQFHQFSQIESEQSQLMEESSNLQHNSLIETKVQNNKIKYNLTIWLDFQDLQKYQELFRKDNIQFKLN